MTELAKKKTKTRYLTSAFVRKSLLVVELDAYTVMIRCKGQFRSTSYRVPWLAVYDLGAKLKVVERRAR